MEDFYLKRAKELYIIARKEKEFEKELKNGTIARINIEMHQGFDFSPYARVSFPMQEIKGEQYQLLILKPTYRYKDNKLIDTKTRRILTSARTAEKIENVK